MRYYKEYDGNGRIAAVGMGLGGTEISETEYNGFLAEIREKAAFAMRLYKGEITAADVPETWREYARNEADKLSALDAEKEAEAGEEDFIAALAELGVTVNEES